MIDDDSDSVTRWNMRIMIYILSNTYKKSNMHINYTEDMIVYDYMEDMIVYDCLLKTYYKHT